MLSSLLKTAGFLSVLLFSFILSFAQDKVVTGKVTDSKDGTAVSGASVVVKGSRSGTSTDNEGNFRLTVNSSASTLVITSVGFDATEVDIAGKTSVTASLTPQPGGLSEVVVTGYGTSKKKDLTGAVTSVKAKDFNKGINSSPDQLIQGKVAGVQVVNNSGAPGGGTSIRIRGNSSLRAGNNPLIVVDGVPLSNTNSRPDIGVSADIGGSTPSGNPLNFINPADIASMDVLKDASAAAIYGSRGSNGVIIITTKKGQSGAPKVDFNASVGISSIMKRLEVLDGNQYRQALADFGFPNTVTTTAVPTANYGGTVDALDAILQKALTQNYGVALSSGNDNARYRLSFSVLDQEGIVRKSDFKKYTAGINSSFKMLDSKKLSLDINLLTSQTIENIAPISNTAGFKGSLIGQALQWNPTRPLRKSDGSLDIQYGSSDINPLAYSEAYFDKATVTSVLANIAPSYKLTKELEYKMQVSVNYSTGTRKAYTTAYININDVALNAGKGGEATISQNELLTKQITNTLSFVKNISANLNLNAVAGHEYLKTNFQGNSNYARGFVPTEKPYYYFMATSDPSTRRTNGFTDPTTELQSFFGRAAINYSDKYLFTATMRADGSSKFGKNNKYGYFPSVAAAWNISNESFMKGTQAVKNLKLRLGWGITGNQEFPAGASQLLYVLNGSNPATFVQQQTPNPNLKWESTTTFNAGLDFTILKGKISGSVDYFTRNTKDILFAKDAADPVTPAGAIKWVNLDANVINKGLEIALNANVVKKKEFSWDVSTNITFLTNELKNFIGEIPTGEVNGQGLSGAYSQLIKSGYPINTFYLKKFTGIDKTSGISLYENTEEKFFLGSANPKLLVGFSTTVMYKKISLEINMNGAFGHYLYNNTANAVTSFNNIGKRNIGLAEYNLAKSLGEKPVNPTSASSRYLEKGNYLKLANASLSYNLGNLGKSIRNANVFITGQNLFVLTDFTGFDPEVNTSKPLNGIPSFGLEYTPYPTSRTFNFGISFSL